MKTAMTVTPHFDSINCVLQWNVDKSEGYVDVCLQVHKLTTVAFLHRADMANLTDQALWKLKINRIANFFSLLQCTYPENLTLRHLHIMGLIAYL